MKYLAKHEIRTLFSRAMSTMYKKEVPQYGTLIEIVESVNQLYLNEHPTFKALLQQTNQLNRISEERHGAIRLGKASELYTIRRLFAVMGMYPVGYYDLSIANIPVHSTAFRPIHDEDLQLNPFRVFTSLLRTELISDECTREMACKILDKRDIFTPRVRELIDLDESQGGLNKEQAQEFVTQALETFRWHHNALVEQVVYDTLKQVHPLVADVVSFKGPHINHLTPRTLDINEVQVMMPKRNLNPKAVIEGPPPRDIPILLRQTSFKALEEAIQFPNKQGEYESGTHQARFGEIEQRGAALTPKGKQLYEDLLQQTREQITPKLDGSNANEYNDILMRTFSQFPDDLESMRQQGLVYCEYRLTAPSPHVPPSPRTRGSSPASNGLPLSREGEQARAQQEILDDLVQQGIVTYSPITYEDFLPVSAAGIFTSNLGDTQPQALSAAASQVEFEQALGSQLIDFFDLYQEKQDSSEQQILAKLKKSTS